MKRREQVDEEQEPVGIIISGWSRTERVPRLTAYVWGPVPGTEPAPSPGEMVAA